MRPERLRWLRVCPSGGRRGRLGARTRASGGTADALASGASVRKDVGVQIPPCAPMGCSRMSGSSLPESPRSERSGRGLRRCWRLECAGRTGHVVRARAGRPSRTGEARLNPREGAFEVPASPSRAIVQQVAAQLDQAVDKSAATDGRRDCGLAGRCGSSGRAADRLVARRGPAATGRPVRAWCATCAGGEHSCPKARRR